MSRALAQTQTRPTGRTPTGRTPTERAPEPYSDPSWIHRIEELFDEREHADVVLAAPGDGRVFHLHRAILAEWSPVLKHLFNDEREREHRPRGQLPRYELPYEGSSAAVDQMLRFFYTGRIDPKDAEEAMTLLAAAVCYEVKELQDICHQLLRPLLGDRECLRLMQREVERISGVSASSDASAPPPPKRGDRLVAVRVLQVRRSKDPGSRVIGHLDINERIEVLEDVDDGWIGRDGNRGQTGSVRFSRGWVDLLDKEDARSSRRDDPGPGCTFDGHPPPGDSLRYRHFALVPYGWVGTGRSSVLTASNARLKRMAFDAVPKKCESKLADVIRGIAPEGGRSRDSDFSDITIKFNEGADKKEYRCHRAILALGSITLADSGVLDDPDSVVRLPRDADGVELPLNSDWLNYFYTRELELPADLLGLKDTLDLGMEYGVDELLLRHCKLLLQSSSALSSSDLKAFEDKAQERRTRRAALTGRDHDEDDVEVETRDVREREAEEPIEAALASAKTHLGVREGAMITRKTVEELVHTLYPTISLRREVDLACRANDHAAGNMRVQDIDVVVKYVLYFRYMWPLFEEVEELSPDGRLSLGEFQRACDHLGEVMTPDEAEKQFEELDEDHRDVVDFDDLCIWAVKRNTHPETSRVGSTSSKQHLLMPSVERRRAAQQRVAVEDDKLLTLSAAQEAIRLLYPGHGDSLEAEVLSAYRAVQVGPVVELMQSGRMDRVEQIQEAHDVEGESPYHAVPELDAVTGRDLRRLLQYLIWLHDRWPKIEVCKRQIPEKGLMTIAEFSCACMLMNEHLEDEEEVRAEFADLEIRRRCPEHVRDVADMLQERRGYAPSRGYCDISDFVSWLVLRQQFDDGEQDLMAVTPGGDDLDLSMPTTSRTSSRVHVAAPRFSAEHALQMPSEERRRELFAKHDRHERGWLTKSGVGEALRELYPRVAAQNHPALSRAFAAADTAGDGQMDGPEFAWFLTYFIYFYRNHAAFEQIASGLKLSSDRDHSHSADSEFIRQVWQKSKHRHLRVVFNSWTKSKYGGDHLRDKSMAQLKKMCEDDDGITQRKIDDADDASSREARKQAFTELLLSLGEGHRSGASAKARVIKESSFHETCESLDIRLGTAEVRSAFKEAAGIGLVDGIWTKRELTFDAFCTWAAVKKCGPQRKPERKPLRQDAHFAVDGGVDWAAPHRMPEPDHCDHIFDQFASASGRLSYTRPQDVDMIADAIARAFPDFEDSGVVVARALTATDVAGLHYITRRQFPVLLANVNFFVCKGHVLGNIQRDHTGRMNPAAFRAAARDLHITLTGEEAAGAFDEIASVNEEHESDLSMKASRTRSLARAHPHAAGRTNNVAFEDFCVWAAREHTKQHSTPQGPELPVPSMNKSFDVFRKHAGGTGFLSLASLSKAVEDVWPELDVSRPITLRAYKAASATSAIRKVGPAEFQICLQFISYLEFAWEALEELELDHERRLDCEAMINACERLGEWLDEEEICDAFDELGNGSETIGFDQFCNWLLNRHVNPPADDEEVGEPAKTTLRLEEAEPQPAVHIPLDPPSKEDRVRLFEEWDEDDNGFLSLDEIKVRLPSLYPGVNHNALKRAYKAADASRNGFVGRREFLKFLKYVTYFHNHWTKFEEIYSACEYPGRLTQGEFRRACSRLGLGFETRKRNSEAAVEFHKMTSKVHDLVLYDEFCSWFARKWHAHDDDEWTETKKYDHMKPKSVFKLGMMYKTGQTGKKDLDEAYVCFCSAADRGFTLARTQLAECLFEGRGVAKDVNHAMSHLTQAAEEGDDTALCKLGLAYMDGNGVPKDHAKAFRCFQDGANRHNDKCQFNLGLCYAQGHGTLQDPEMAAQYYTQAAQQGLSQAQNNLGECYMTGNGVPLDLPQGLKYHKMASDQGLAEAQFNLGLAYVRGHGADTDMSVGIKYLALAKKQKHEGARKALEQLEKDKEAQKHDLLYAKVKREYFGSGRLGTDFKAGLSDGRKARALDKLKECAMNGTVEAQWHRAKLADEGKLATSGSPRPNVRKAAQMYRQPAAAGHVESLNRLGEILMELGFEEDSIDAHWAEAVRNFTKAAEATSAEWPNGHTEAQYNLGEAWMARAFSGDEEPDLEHPTVVDSDAANRAVGWFVKAAEGGHQRAQFNLGVLYQNTSDVVHKDVARAVLYLRMAAERPKAVTAKYSLACLLLKEGGEGTTLHADRGLQQQRSAGPGNLTWTRLGHATEDAESSLSEAKELFEQAADLGSEEACDVLDYWDDVVEAVRGEGSIEGRIEELAAADGRVAGHIKAFMVAEIDRERDVAKLLELESRLEAAKSVTEEQRTKTQDLREANARKEARNSRLLLVSSRARQAHRLAAAGAETSTCVPFEWSGTQLDALVDMAREAMSPENRSRRYKTAALWTFTRHGGIGVTEKNRLTLGKLRTDDACRRFWTELADLVDEDGYIVLFGLGSADDTEEWHEMLTELSTLVGRGIVVPDIAEDQDVLEDGSLSEEAVSNQDFCDFFDIKLAEAWARSVRPVLDREREQMAPYEQRAAQHDSLKRAFDDKTADAEERHRHALEKEGRADYRVQAEEDRLKRREERERATPRLRSRVRPGEVNEIDEVQAALHRSDIDQVQLMVGIDFSGSNEWNGCNSFGGRSLHAVDSGVPTPYESAIEAAVETLSVFDDADKSIPCYGFGNRRTYSGRIPSVFSLRPRDEPCRDLEDIRQQYRSAAKGVQLGTQDDRRSFAPIINKAIEVLNERRERDDETAFDQLHILLIVTDGAAFRDGTPNNAWSAQEMETVQAIRKASHLPLSIICIGVGDGSATRVADDEGLAADGRSWQSLHEMERSILDRQFDNFVFAEYGLHCDEGDISGHGAKLARLMANATRDLPEQWKSIRRLAISDPWGPHEVEFDRAGGSDSSDSSDSDSDSDDSYFEPETPRQYVSLVRTKDPPSEEASTPSPRDFLRKTLSAVSAVTKRSEPLAEDVDAMFSELDVDGDGTLSREELASVVDAMPEFGGERFSDWHFRQFCELSGIEAHDGLTAADFRNYCKYMSSRSWAERAFCVYDRAGKGWLEQEELVKLCADDFAPYARELKARLPNSTWNSTRWSEFFHEYAPGAVSDGRTNWPVFSRFVYHMRYLAGRVSTKERTKRQARKLKQKTRHAKQKLQGGASTQDADDDEERQKDAEQTVEFNQNFEHALLAQRKKVGPLSDSEQEEELELGLEPEPEPEPEPRTVRRPGNHRDSFSESSSDDDDLQ